MKVAAKTIKLQVKLTDKDMLGFFRQHTYSHFSGIAAALFGVICLAMLIRSAIKGDLYYATIFAIFVYFLLIAQPVGLRKKAKDQVKNVPLFQKPFFYELSEKGIRIFQGEQSQEASWEQIYRVVGNKNGLYVYTNKKNAWIIPATALVSNRDAVVQYLRDHVSKEKVKIRS
jgi:hypothetical protein